MQTTIESACEYCGGEQIDCHFCLKKKKHEAAKRQAALPIKRRVAPVGLKCLKCLDKSEGFYYVGDNARDHAPIFGCLTCHREALESKTAKLFKVCPTCRQGDISPCDIGLKCNLCKTVWHPGEDGVHGPVIKCQNILNSSAIKNTYCNDMCPGCGFNDSSVAVIGFSHADRKCLFCETFYRTLSGIIDSEDERVPKAKKKQEITSLLPCIVCPVCDHRNLVKGTKFNCLCGECEQWINVDEFSVKWVSEEVEDCRISDNIKNIIEEAERFKEFFSDLDIVFDKILDEFQALKESIDDNRDTVDELTDLGSSIEEMGSVLQQIKHGNSNDFDEDDVFDLDDDRESWMHDDSENFYQDDDHYRRKHQWDRFDDIHKISKILAENSYHTVSIEEKEGDLSFGEEIVCFGATADVSDS